MNILCFDVESNGLHGPAFAVAGVCIDTEGKVTSEFLARCPIEGKLDEWVRDNVLEPMRSIAQTHPNAKSMRHDFWEWYVKAKASVDMIVCANPYPVESRFLMECQRDDMSAREFDHPFPLFDVSSMMAGAGLVSSTDRANAVAAALEGRTGEAHNPLWDATASALTARYLMLSASKQ